MGCRIVRVSRVLFQELFTQGKTFPSADNERLRVVTGLPEGAKIEAINESGSLMLNGDIVMRFSHPSWADTPEGHTYPELRIELQWDHTQEFQPFLFDKLTPEAVQQLSAKLAERHGGGRFVYEGHGTFSRLPADEDDHRQTVDG